MLREKMFVRCNCDEEYPKFPREFCCGKIAVVNNQKNTAMVSFYDTNGFSNYYELPKDNEYSLNGLIRCEIKNGSIVEYEGKKYKIVASKFIKEDDLYYYYISNEQNEVLKVSELDIIASVNDGMIEPIHQIYKYEFQNPVFYFGHANVSRKMQIIENSLYGFKVLAGCKVFLKPHQVKTVMRCLKEDVCRFMIADEVGLGKTIEALSILKIYLLSKSKQHVAIVVPDSLVEQWKVEAAFKFKLFEDENVNDNHITFLGFKNIDEATSGFFDFVIIDEVHRLIWHKEEYNKALQISKNVKNIIMLSATPIQKRNEEYQKLLTLINPQKYENMPSEQFDMLLSQQNKLIRKIYNVLECLDSLYDEIANNEYNHNDETEEIYEEIIDELKSVQNIIKDDIYAELISNLNYCDERFDIDKIQLALAFVCENYQLEKSIIRNRRAILSNNNERKLVEISYDIQTEFNNTEFNLYNILSSWIEENTNDNIDKKIIVLKSFFSSASAFYANVCNYDGDDIPIEMIKLLEKFVLEEKKSIDNIVEYMDNHTFSKNRILSILNFINQEAKNGKILLFTNYKETFDLYKKAICEYIGENSCSFFNKNMSHEELEINSYKFQNDKDCYFMLSDESGGEGRNFQHASKVVHIDLPWNANELEQRIGRLDRIGRKEDLPVVSVVAYAENTLENDLFYIWDKGLNIFNTSQSGLEIIMNEIDGLIYEALVSDVKYGLNNINEKIIVMINELNKVVRQERYFDLAAYKYSSINKILDNSIEYFNKEETNLFSESMLSWAALTGFHGTKTQNNCLLFTQDGIAIKSFERTKFIPPNFKKLVDDKMNQMRNKIRGLAGKKKVTIDNYILGTFDRSYAISNDYIHFYAPGDEIYDSIVSNALGSYKGKSSAFAIKSRINWSGFVFVWKLCLNDYLIYENNINPNLLNQYRGFLPQTEFITVYSIDDSTVSDIEVENEYKRLLAFSDKKNYKHYGKRDSIQLANFIQKYPKDVWHHLVKTAYNEARQNFVMKMKGILKPSLDNLKIELGNVVGVQKALAIYYNREEEFEKIEKESRNIELIMSKPRIILDSICFIDMVKSDE